MWLLCAHTIAFESGPLASRIMFSVSNMCVSRKFQLSAEPWYITR